MFVGLIWMYIAISALLSIPRTDSDPWWSDLGFVALLLGLGAWLTHDCYLMLRGRGFRAIQLISAFLALMFLNWVDAWLGELEPGAVGARGHARHLVGLATILTMAIIYFICMKLLNRLCDAAYGPDRLPGNHPSTDEQAGNES